jgi:hypothetical protein
VTDTITTPTVLTVDELGGDLPSLQVRLDRVRESGIVTGTRVVVTALSRLGEANTLRVGDYDPDGTYLYQHADATDRSRTFFVRRPFADGSELTYWVADIAPHPGEPLPSLDMEPWLTGDRAQFRIDADGEWTDGVYDGACGQEHHIAHPGLGTQCLRSENIRRPEPEPGRVPDLPVYDFAIGEDVVCISNILPDGNEGDLGAAYIGRRGRVTDVGTDFNDRPYVRTAATSSLHPISFVKWNDLDRIAEEWSSHRETGFAPGDRVEFEFAGITVTGTVVQEIEERPDRVQVQTDAHGLLFPLVAEVHRQDPEVWARSLTIDNPLYERAQDLIREIEQARARKADAEERRKAFLTEVETIASRVANEEEWCPVADSGMAALGLTRQQPEDEEPELENVSWTTTVTVNVSYSLDDDTAAELIANNYELDVDTVEIPGYNTIEGRVEITVEGTIEDVAEGSCVCSQVDTDEIRNALPDWARDEDWNEGTTYCDND